MDDYITKEKASELARLSGAKVEQWMTNPPRDGLFYMTPDQVQDLCNAAIAHYMSKINPAKNPAN